MRDAMSRRTSPHPGTGTARSSTMARVTGIAALVSSTVRGNVVYSNTIGVQGAHFFYGSPVDSSDLRFSGTIVNNVIYANSIAGILITGAAGGQVTNNTVYQPQGDGPFPALLDLHGGAWNNQDRTANAMMDENLAWKG